MSILLSFVVGGIITLAIAYEYFFSPKATIKRLWKDILSIAMKISEMKKESTEDYNPLVLEYENIIAKKEKLIKNLIEYYLDPEEDEEFIEEYKA